ncbi:MAG: iron ABC transporter permease [Thermoanaerobaculia bacterium]|nr:iron ABC transporter permease [Thermoanaerobaculia bacterium]
MRGRVFVVLGASVLAAAALSLAMGAVSIAPGEVIEVISRRLGVAIGDEPSFRADAVLWNIRLPRILLALVVGAGLGLAGAALQGLFRNPLADPQLLGIGPGASLGAVAGMLAIEATSPSALAGGAAGGVAAAALLRRFAEPPSPDPSRFILSGVALGAVLSAWVGFAVFAADRAAVPPVEFWLLGSLTGATWRTLANTLVLTAAGSVVLFASSRSLDLLSLGEPEARHLGVDVDLVRSLTLFSVGLVTGAAVGAVGVVGFVGLLVPHVVRRATGPGHRRLLAGSALAGAAFVALADLGARTLASPVEIPVGLLTAAVGGPFFLWLLLRATRREPA